MIVGGLPWRGRSTGSPLHHGAIPGRRLAVNNVSLGEEPVPLTSPKSDQAFIQNLTLREVPVTGAVVAKEKAWEQHPQGPGLGFSLRAELAALRYRFEAPVQHCTDRPT